MGVIGEIFVAGVFIIDGACRLEENASEHMMMQR